MSVDVSLRVFRCFSLSFLLQGFLPLVFSPSPLSTLGLEFQEGSKFRVTPLLLHPKMTPGFWTCCQAGALNCLGDFFLATWAQQDGWRAHTTHPVHCSCKDTMTMIMFGDSHLESQRCHSLQSPHVPGLLSTHRSTVTQDVPQHRTTRLSRHSHILTRFSPQSLSSSHTCREKGRDSDLTMSLTMRGKVSKQVCLRGTYSEILTILS